MLGTFWHVPVFLCVAGFFLKRRILSKPDLFIRKKWKQLYVKLIVFYAFFIFLHNFFFKIGFYSTDALYVGKHIAPYSSLKDYVIAGGWGLVAAREPFLGAMWFVNLLFLGLCILSLTSYLLSKTKLRNNEYARGTLILSLCVFSCYLTHVIGINITRLTPALCGTWLVYSGFVINTKLKIRFDNFYVFIGSLLLMFEMCSIFGVVSMADDLYEDVVILTIGTVCSLYVLCFVAKKIEKTIIGTFFSWCGRESYYIMALHLLGFKMVAIVFTLIGVSKPWDSLFSPANNVPEWLAYTVSGVFFSLFVAFLIKKAQSLVTKKNV